MPGQPNSVPLPPILLCYTDKMRHTVATRCSRLPLSATTARLLLLPDSCTTRRTLPTPVPGGEGAAGVLFGISGVGAISLSAGVDVFTVDVDRC